LKQQKLLKIYCLNKVTGSPGSLKFSNRRSCGLLRCDDSPVRRFAAAIRFFGPTFRTRKND